MLYIKKSNQAFHISKGDIMNKEYKVMLASGLVWVVYPPIGLILFMASMVYATYKGA